MIFELDGFWYAMAIMFWILLAIAVVTLISDAWLNIIYYRWNKEDREQLKLEHKVGEIIEAKINPDRVISEVEN